MERLIDWEPAQRRVVTKVLDAVWQDLAPNAPSHFLRGITRSFVERGATKADVDDLVQRVAGLKTEEQVTLGSMLSKQMSPEQVLLLVLSPKDEHEMLKRSWEAASTRSHKIQDMTEKAKTLVGIGTKGVAVSTLLVLAAGLTIDNPALVESAAITTQMSDMLLSENRKTWGAGIGSFAIAWAFKDTLLKLGSLAFQEVTRANIDEDLKRVDVELKNRVAGVFGVLGEHRFPVPGGAMNIEQAFLELDAVPSPYRPLLTHFQPRELVMFLGAQDDARTEMMRAHAPSTEQRVLTSRKQTQNRFRAVTNSIQQALVSWDTPGSSVTVGLGNSMEALRKARRERQESGVLPVPFQRAPVPKP